MEIRHERNWGLWAAGAIAIVVIVLAAMWWRGDLGSTAVDAPAPSAPATSTSPAPATTPAPAAQQ